MGANEDEHPHRISFIDIKKSIEQFFLKELAFAVTFSAMVVVLVINMFVSFNQIDNKIIMVFIALLLWKSIRFEQQVGLLETKAKEIDRNLKILQELSPPENVHYAKVCDSHEFHSKMLRALRTARKEILLTNLAPNVPPDDLKSERSIFYHTLHDFMADHTKNTITYRRIVAITTKEKLEWIKDIIEKTKLCPNVHIGYISTEYVDHTKPLSLQIFDANEVFIADPTTNVDSDNSEGENKLFWIRGSHAPECFKTYHTNLWKKTKILKSGTKINSANIAEVDRLLTQAGAAAKV